MHRLMEGWSRAIRCIPDTLSCRRAPLRHVLRPLYGYCLRLLRGRVATRASTRMPPRRQLYRATCGISCRPA